MHYTQLTQVQRYQIYALMKAGLNQTQIAIIVGVHNSTISFELNRNHGQRGYRPWQAHKCCRLGGWVLDTVIGKIHYPALGTLVERKSRLTLIARVVSKVIIRLLKPLSPWVHTLTAENGREFSRHQKIAKALSAKFYLAHSFALWERGLNENINSLIRQYFTKNHDFKTITQQQIERVMDKLNNRSRKFPGIKTPNQVFFGFEPNVALAT